MLKFSEIFEFSGENSYFERIRMVRMVRMVRSLADRTFQLCGQLRRLLHELLLELMLLLLGLAELPVREVQLLLDLGCKKGFQLNLNFELLNLNLAMRTFLNFRTSPYLFPATFAKMLHFGKIPKKMVKI